MAEGSVVREFYAGRQASRRTHAVTYRRWTNGQMRRRHRRNTPRAAVPV